MLRLSDAELDTVFAAARPLDVRARDAFRQEVAEALGRLPEHERGVGSVHRVVAEIQRRHWDPPQYASGPAARGFER